MLEFPEPPKEYSSVFLEETDKPLPERIDPRTRYAFFSTIARGGKSLIKSCKDLHLSRYICYKTLKPEFADDELEQKRLIREARVTAMLQHPNTVPTYELGRDGRGHPYFTMKLVHGYTLREIFNYRARYDLTQLMEVLLQVAFALDYAHTHGVAHRDIKPENVLVGPYGEILVLDWGLAKVWNPDGSVAGSDDSAIKVLDELSLTGAGKAQGTLHYMSPEQASRNPDIDHRSDIYSFGAVLYEALCGETPAKGDKVHLVVDSVLNEEAVPPSQVSTLKIPSLLEQIALRCLAKDPAKRYQNMAEIILLLQRDWQWELLPES